MPFDGLFMRRVVEEIDSNIKGPLRNIYQPTKVDYYLYFQDGTVRISLNPSHSFISISDKMKENPAMPPSFTMLLRKFLRNARFLGVEQIGYSRVAVFRFKRLDEKGDEVEYELHAEIMGKFSNVILVRDGKILDAHRRISTKMGREIFPGREFVPFSSEKVDPFEFDVELLWRESGKVEKVLLSKLEGFSRTMIHELLFRAGVDPDEEVSNVDPGKIELALEDLLNEYSLGFTYTLYDGEIPVDISPVILKHGNFDHVSKSPSDAVNSLYVYLEKMEALGQRKRELEKVVRKKLEDLEDTLEKVWKDFESSKDFELYRKRGELLLAYAHTVRDGDTEAELEDWETGRIVKVKIDPKLGPVKTAQEYFKKYEKLKRKHEASKKRLEEIEREIEYLRQLFQTIYNAETEEDLESVREEMERFGLVRSQKGKRERKTSGPRRYSFKGFEILVGRNNIQNDELVRSSSPNDIWLHAHEMPGAHVVIRTGGKDVPEDVLRYAASLAARYSKGRLSGTVPVDYTYVRYVRKPKGFKPGLVLYTNYKTVRISPD